jgi:hypothetical protein
MDNPTAGKHGSHGRTQGEIKPLRMMHDCPVPSVLELLASQIYFGFHSELKVGNGKRLPACLGGA